MGKKIVRHFMVVVEGPQREGEQPGGRRVYTTGFNEADVRKNIETIERQLAKHFGDDPWPIVSVEECGELSV